MKRRVILSMTASASIGTALPAIAQPHRVAHVGQLGNQPLSEQNNAALHKIVAATMKMLGWEIGRNLVWDYKSG
ncbi:MAG: hypothetical protein ABI645_17030, partial [Pseudomonadota bacterium]